MSNSYLRFRNRLQNLFKTEKQHLLRRGFVTADLKGVIIVASVLRMQTLRSNIRSYHIVISVLFPMIVNATIDAQAPLPPAVSGHWASGRN